LAVEQLRNFRPLRAVLAFAGGVQLGLQYDVAGLVASVVEFRRDNLGLDLRLLLALVVRSVAEAGQLFHKLQNCRISTIQDNVSLVHAFIFEAGVRFVQVWVPECASRCVVLRGGGALCH